MNPFEDPALATTYESWYDTVGRRADRLEKALLDWLLRHFPQARTLLEVGCGTGHFTRWLAGHGLSVVGVDLSAPMLDEALRLGDGTYVQGNALKLPFATATFDLVVFVTALEFIPEPGLALAEALRVARQGLLLGVLNRSSRLGRQLKSEGGPVWDAAHFFAPTELEALVRRVANRESVEIIWRTTLWPLWEGALPLPWGGFIGMAVKRN